MSTPETIRADAREDERYAADGPSPDQPCDPEFCGWSDESEPATTDGQGPLYVHEVSHDTADVMVYCTCEHHNGTGAGDNIERRVTWASGMTYYDTRAPEFRKEGNA